MKDENTLNRDPATPEFSREKASWLMTWMNQRAVESWGVADLRNFKTPVDENGQSFPIAVSWAAPMNPQIMAGITNGPDHAYAEEYRRVNQRINELSTQLSAAIKALGFRARALAASERTDPVLIKGDFPHKTAATRAGLGWVGLNCQLITRNHGPWLRLGTIFTDMPLPSATSVTRSLCGACTRCVDACPAKALKGVPWHPGIERERILNAQACDNWKKKHYPEYNNGHNCGICTAVCPVGHKLLRR